jgi:signal transduction histidine kinase
MGLLEMATIHHEALSNALVRRGVPSSLEQDLRRAEQFFTESISLYQVAHREVRDAQTISALMKLNDTLEQEMRRIAHAVHDDAGQLLDAARLAMARVAHDLGPTLRERLLKEVGTILDQVEHELRRFSHELRPTILDDLGLVPALQFLADGISKRANLAIQVESSLQGRAEAAIETALYRVVQEALNNVTRHASARNVKIQLKRDDGHLQCSVHDDGVGFDVPSVLSQSAKRGLGLIGISERLNAVRGTLQINSVVGRGTDLLIEIPVGK